MALKMLRAELNRIQIPYRLLVGNHDDRAALLKTFPEIVPQEGFIQYAEDLDGVRILYLDTLASEGKHTGELCQKRLSWLQKQVTTAKDAPLIIFMHHPPSKLGIPAFDRLRLEDCDMLSDILKMHGGTFRF